MRAIVSRGAAVDIRGYEVAPVTRIVAELQPATLVLVSEATRLLLSIVEECERSPRSIHAASDGVDAVRTSYLPFERAIDATVATARRGSHKAVEEIAFMAQLELRQRAERLERLTSGHGPVVLLGECDSSLRRVRKALNAVDAAIAGAEAIAPLLDFTSELHTSLAVRRAYAKLRARLLADGEPTAQTIRARMRGVGTQIAVLIGRDVYPEMRVRDRLLLRELQQRVLGWLREGDMATAEGGLRLWRDIASSVEMFSLVNRRQELVEHDLLVVRTAVAQLQSAVVGEVDPGTWKRVRSLEGLDPELDALLCKCEPPSRQVLAQVLARVAGRLGSVDDPPGALP